MCWPDKTILLFFMDSPSHALWTYALEKSFWPEFVKTNPGFLFVSLFFSILPDLIVDAPFVLYLLFNKHKYHLKTFKEIINFGYTIIQQKPLEYETLFPWSAKTAFYSHSFLTYFLIAIILKLAYPETFLPFVVGYGIHLLIDIPLHNDYFSSKPFYPLSKIKIPGWLTWYHTKNFQKYNYALLALVYIILLSLNHGF